MLTAKQKIQLMLNEALTKIAIAYAAHDFEKANYNEGIVYACQKILNEILD
jgi:hypothetical protein